jgi:hypothetical protein
VIATLITVPVVLIVGLALGHANEHHHPATSTSPGALPPVTVAAPPSKAAAIAPCTKVLTMLPTSLDGLQSRPAFSTSSLVVAWGDPAVVLRCGVNRPAGLVPGSDAFTTGVDGVLFWVVHAKDSTVFTVIDRAVYVEVTVPSTYAGGPLAPIADAVRSALPAVCVVSATETDPAKLCTHRP